MSESSTRFFYSVLRVVPDPIKDEAVNIGVVVTSDTGGAYMQVKVPRARIRAAQRSISLDGLDRSIGDLAHALGIDLQLVLGESETGTGPATSDRLRAIAGSLSNQLQLTQPRAYLAFTGDDALVRLFRRYVARQAPHLAKAKPLTRAVLKGQVWRVIRDWQGQNVRVEPAEFVRGQDATHPVDFVVLNGHPRAAVVALATHPDDLKLSYLYRDSIPTIADDMGENFRVYAVLPGEPAVFQAAEQNFAVETEKLLGSAPGVTTVRLNALDSIHPELAKLLL